MNFGLPELLIILVIVLLLFGSTRLPKLSRSIGQSIRELREGFNTKEPPAKSAVENKKPDYKKDEPKVGARPRGRPPKVRNGA